MRTQETDVLVVGAGPTGITTGALLAKYGIDAITLSRHPGPAHQPRGSFTNQRTIEVFRDLGIEKDIHRVGTPLREIGHNVMATSFAGPEILRYECYGVGRRLADYALASPCQNYNIPQHILEPVLMQSAIDQGADVRYSHELLDIEQDSNGVRAWILDRSSGEEYEVRARYAVAADGGRSKVAEQIGFTFTGESDLMHMANAWVEADLTEFVQHRPAGQYIILQPGGDSWVGSGTFVTVAPWTEWLFSREYDPANGEPDQSDRAVIQAVRQLVGDDDIPVRVKGTSLWKVNAVLANEFQKGRIFIAGDAAHRHSPSGGLGTNTSVQDAYNLAWKLAMVINEQAGEELLKSYHEERHPVGHQVVTRAMYNLHNKAKVGEALGLHRKQSSDEGWQSLRELFEDVPGAEDRRKRLTAAVELQEQRSTAHGVDLGQRYSSQAVVDDGIPFPPPRGDENLYYHPTTHPGAYLPHVWLEKDRRKISTLDLVGSGRFSLITGIGGRSWRHAAEIVSQALGLELPCFEIGYRSPYDDVLGDWYRIREIDDRGALLVRPDGYIAWRSMSDSVNAEKELRTAITQVLSLDHKSSVSAPRTEPNTTRIG